MKLLYDEKHDILDVVFREGEIDAPKSGYQLRDGIILHISSNMSPLQLTLVNFRRLVTLPVIHFDCLQNQPEEIRQTLLSLIASPPLSALLRIDARTNYGHVMSPALLDVCSV